MPSRLVPLAALIALLSGGAATDARAADLCFDYDGGGSLVAKRFRIPAKDKCVPFMGFEPVSLGAVFTGTACTQANGYDMILHYTLSRHGLNDSYFETGDCRVYLPFTDKANTLASPCYGTYIATPGSTGRFFDTARVYWCTEPIPVPY